MSTASAAPVDTPGKVIRAVDGDTVIARIDGKTHRIQITGLNAMELTDYRAGHWTGECLVLWLPDKVEYLPNSSYPALAAQAAADRRWLWNTDACGAGPSQNATLRVTVKWQGAETVSIANQGANPVDLANWWVRDSSYHGKLARGYTFSAGTVIPLRHYRPAHRQGLERWRPLLLGLNDYWA